MVVGHGFDSRGGDVGTKQREGRAMTRFVGTVAEFASEHAGHDVRLCCIEVVDVSYYAAAGADGTLSTDWEVNDTYNVETRTTDAQCRTCGVIVTDVDASAIVVTL